MYTIQNKNYVILIMYNKSNAITCFKCEIKFLENIKSAKKIDCDRYKSTAWHVLSSTILQPFLLPFPSPKLGPNGILYIIGIFMPIS